MAESKRLDVCRLIIGKVIRYYSFALLDIKIMCITVLFSFKVESSLYPITTREGMKAKILRWTEVMIANSSNEPVKKLDKSNHNYCPLSYELVRHSNMVLWHLCLGRDDHAQTSVDMTVEDALSHSSYLCLH